MYKAVLFVCAQALFIQSIAGQCGPRIAAPLAAAPCGCGLAGPLGIAGPYGAYGPAGIAASNGGGLGVTSASAIPPNGVSVLSENAIEGPLAVAGALPFLGTVALEGLLPTAGAGVVNYGCGNGAVGIVAEEVGPVGIAGPFGYGGLGYAGYDGLGYAGYDGLGYAGLGYAGALGYDGLGYAGALGYDGFGYGGLGYADGYGYGLAGPYRAGCGYGALI